MNKRIYWLLAGAVLVRAWDSYKRYLDGDVAVRTALQIISDWRSEHDAYYGPSDE